MDHGYCLSRYPDLGSIKDLGTFFSSPWKRRDCPPSTSFCNMSQIEHDMLRAFQGPPGPFCRQLCIQELSAAPGNAVYGTAPERQLDPAAAADRLAKPCGSAKFSSWFAEDFNGDVVGYFINYAEGPLVRLRRTGGYLDYDSSSTEQSGGDHVADCVRHRCHRRWCRGLTVASGAAQLGSETLLIEKEPALGGDCLHYGCVP